MAYRRPIVAGNWKLNGSRQSSRALAVAIVDGLAGIDLGPARLGGESPPLEVLLCPPFVYLAELADLLAVSQLRLGAQDVAAEDVGAFTGEVAAAMLREVGCRYVITGHSERRALFGDTDEKVAGKVLAALRAGLSPILCVGETRSERDAGHTLTVVRRQLDVVLAALDSGRVSASERRLISVA